MEYVNSGETPEHVKLPRSGIFIVNFKHISHFALVFLLLILNMYFPAGFTDNKSHCDL